MADLTMMDCGRLKLRVSTAGCGRLYAKAMEVEPKAWEPRTACRFCPVGAANSGAVVVPMAQEVAELRKICPRCTRPATRMINGEHCVSCYNRLREVAKGRNAKGNRPRLADVLHSSIILVADGPNSSVKVAPQVASRREAILAFARQATGPMAFGVAPLGFR